MGFLNLFGPHSPVHIHMVTLLSRAKHMGTDQLGNQYFQAKARKGYHHARRWVMYKDAPEASNVPPEWHGWLHHQTDTLPDSKTRSFRRRWQKPHQPNMTGTNKAYHPKNKIDETTGHYEAWSPPQ